MFTLDDLLGAPVPLGKPLGRRPFKELAAVLTRKPHRFLPPNVPELRVPGDAAAIQLINEAFADVEAISGATGLAAVRATIERPQVRAAGRPLGNGRRDYTLGSAVADGATLWRFVLLTVRVRQEGSATRLEAVRIRLIDPSQVDILRHELAAVYADAEARHALLAAGRPSVVWLRGGESPGAVPGWAPLLEGVASTYGVRLRVLQDPTSNLEQTRSELRSVAPLVAIVWDYDGRGTELELRLGLDAVGCEVEHVYGEWAEAMLAAGELFAELRDVAPPERAAPRSVAEAVDQAQTHPDVVLLPSALSSARASVFRRPADVRHAIEVLVAAVADGALDAPGGLEAALASSPFRYASGVSATAHQQYTSHYRRTYDGRTIMLGPHLKLGAGSPEFCLRIYWYVDSAAGKVVVGHIGDHLPDAGS
jgi:hypothetical protein